MLKIFLAEDEYIVSIKEVVMIKSWLHVFSKKFLLGGFIMEDFSVVNLKKGELHKRIVVDFSYTTLLFGSFVPLFRKDWKWGGIMFGTWACLCVILIITAADDSVATGLFALRNLFFAFIYNKIYIINLLAQGFEPESEADRVTLKAAGLRE